MKSKLSSLGFVLILSALIVSGCGTTAAQTTKVPVDTRAARDAALAYISEHYNEQAPAPGLAWTGGSTLPLNPPPGWAEYRFTSGDWVITIDHAVLPPEWTIYQVTVVNRTTGFQWEGEVNAAGQAAELLAPEEARTARAVALAYIAQHYGEQADPGRGVVWMEERTTPEGLVGSETWESTSGDWVITISYPVAAPEAVIYQVVVANESTGFRWEGELDAAWQVTETLAPSGVEPVVQPPEPGRALDAALAYIREHYGEQAPSPDLTWVGDHPPAEEPVGLQTFEFTSESASDWVVTVSFPVVAPEYIVYQVVVANQITAFRWEGEVDASGEVTEQLAPTGEQPVVGWLGHVVSLPDGSQFDDYLVLAQGAGEVGLTGADADVEAEIVALRDKEEPGKYAHFWGALTCDMADYGDCQLVVTRLDPGTPPGPRFDPDPVEGWQGRVFSIPGMAQFDDYFVLDGPFPVQFGIRGADEALQAQLEDLRDTSATIRIWGEIQCAIPDTMGCSIGVERWELVSEESPPLGVHFESPVVGWYGQVVGLPADGRYNDFLRLLPLGSGDVGLTGADAALEAEIEGWRNSTTNAHFWGAIACGVPDYDGCQVTVTRIVPEGAGPYPDPDPVEGWEGRYFFGAGLGGFDDCFILDFYGPFGVRYGIRGADDAVQAALEGLRSMDKLTDPPPDIQIWGEVQCGVSDVNGCQIIVDRLEELFSRP